MAITGVILGTHEDTRFKSERKTPTLTHLEFIGFGKGPELDQQLKLTGKISEGVIFTRELVNSPANVLTPGIEATFLYAQNSPKHCNLNWNMLLIVYTALFSLCLCS